jgi:hypothetical protein
MPRKQQTEAEKAQTPLQEQLIRCATTCQAISIVLDKVEQWNKLSHQDAICALRDYFQWLLAAESDKALAEIQQRVTDTPNVWVGV